MTLVANIYAYQSQWGTMGKKFVLLKRLFVSVLFNRSFSKAKVQTINDESEITGYCFAPVDDVILGTAPV